MGRISLAFGVLFIVSAASVSAAEFPARKAGLWEITIAGGHSIKVRQCSDAASDQAMAQAGIGFPGDCAKHDVQESGGTITIVSACKSAGKTVVSHMVITGSLDSNYTMTVTSQDAGTSGPVMILYGRWLGPCGVDQKPGDVIMPNGTKINILRSAETREPGAH